MVFVFLSSPLSPFFSLKFLIFPSVFCDPVLVSFPALHIQGLWRVMLLAPQCPRPLWNVLSHAQSKVDPGWGVAGHWMLDWVMGTLGTCTRPFHQDVYVCALIH